MSNRKKLNDIDIASIKRHIQERQQFEESTVDVLRAQIRINSPISKVWKIFTDPATWQIWHGGELKSVEPGWQPGARMHWKRGNPSLLLEVEFGKKITISDQSIITTWTFESEAQKTDVAVTEDVSQSNIIISDPNFALGELQDELKDLKKLVESWTSDLPKENDLAPSTLIAKPWWKFW